MRAAECVLSTRWPVRNYSTQEWRSDRAESMRIYTISGAFENYETPAQQRLPPPQACDVVVRSVMSPRVAAVVHDVGAGVHALAHRRRSVTAS